MPREQKLCSMLQIASCAAICLNMGISVPGCFFNILGITTFIHFMRFKKITALIWILQNMQHFSGFAANMQQYGVAAALYGNWPYLNMIIISDNPPLPSFMLFCPIKQDICNMLQIVNYAAILQQHAAAWAYFYLKPLITFLGT